MSKTSQHTPGFEFYMAYNALFWSMVSLVQAGLFLMVRKGLYTPRLLILACIFIFISAAFSPFLFPARFHQRFSSRLFVYPLISLAVLASPLLFWRFHSYAIYFYAILGIAGVFKGLPHLKKISIGQILFLVIFVPLLSAYFFIFINQADYANVFAPEQALLGKIRKDSYYATSIAHMLQNYGVSSTGLDGLVPHHYHYGSHMWFAMLGRLAGTPPLFSYAIGLFLILVPSQFYALILSGICVAKERIRILEYFLICLSLVYITDAIGRNTHYISESYNSAITALLFLFPLLMSQLRSSSRSCRENVFWILFMLAMLYPLTALKISVGILFSISLACVVVRVYGFNLKTIIYLLVLAGVESLAFKIYNDPGQPAIFAPLKFFASHPRLLFFTSWLVPVLAITASALDLEIKNLNDLKNAFRSKATIDIELLILVGVIGALPAFLLWLSIAWAWAFFNVVQWMAFPVLFYHLSWRRIESVKTKTPVLILALLIAIPVIYKSGVHTRNAFWFGYLKNARQFLAGLSSQNKQSPGAPPGDLYGAELARLFQKYPGYKAYSLIMEAAEGRTKNFAVFVPPENREFWTMLKNCVALPMFVPAVTGKMMLMGLSPVEFNCELEYYGYSNYPPDAHSHNTDDESLCRRARSKKIQTVFILNDLNQKNQNRILNCGQ